MRLKRTLTDLRHVVVEETERNPRFASLVKEALGPNLLTIVIEEAERNAEFASRMEGAIGLKKSANRGKARSVRRRNPAVLDPIQLAREGEATLRTQLGVLSLEQLKDVIADYGMDFGQLVRKWKRPERIINRIVEVSLGRAKKGEGFLLSGSGGVTPS